MIYEALKAQLIARRSRSDLNGNEKTSKDFLEFMMAGAISKTIASCISYPHGESRFIFNYYIKVKSVKYLIIVYIRSRHTNKRVCVKLLVSLAK